MTARVRELLPVLARITGSEPKLSLTDVAAIAATSPSHFQRRFSEQLRESPTQYQRRLRLERAAALLLSTPARIIDIAIAVQFETHESFTRAFHAHFGVSPSDYRTQASASTPDQAINVFRTGPCVALYRVDLSPKAKDETMDYEISRQTLDEQPVLFGRRKAPREELAGVFAEVLPAVFGYAMENGLAMTGPPFVRYVNQSAAFFEVEAGVPLAEPAVAPADRPDLIAGSLPGGDAAVTVHVGPYDTLGDAHIALDKWIDSESLKGSSGPWEIYLTDPAEVPDPAEWKTWPLM